MHSLNSGLMAQVPFMVTEIPNGESANATAKALNERGLPSARGGKWTARSVINVRARLAQ